VVARNLLTSSAASSSGPCGHWHHCQRLRALHRGDGRPNGRPNGGHSRGCGRRPI